MLLNNPKLRSSIDKLWQAFWSGGISNPLTAIEQITYLLFMKQLERLDDMRRRAAKFTKEPYASPFDGFIMEETASGLENIAKSQCCACSTHEAGAGPGQ